jgi:peptide/nickel transport system ATP-binding protein
MTSILSVRNLSVSYKTRRGLVKAVDDVSLEFERGRIYSLVGESGCGKSTIGLALSRLLIESQVVYAGNVDFGGVNLLSLKEQEMVKYRGTGISTIFQEPMTSLDPVYRIGEQIAESLSVREKRLTVHDSRDYSYGSKEARSNATNRMIGRTADSRMEKRKAYAAFRDETLDLLKRVRIASPEKVAEMYPHELSGGMKQRAMIAMVLAEKPAFIVADEPTTALDVTTQVQVLALIKEIVDEIDTGVLLITHDLGVVAGVADTVAVMYAGKIVEEAKVQDLLNQPLHPYTEGLIGSFPKGDKHNNSLVSIPGVVPSIGAFPTGCRFRPRCSKVFQMCTNSPALYERENDHKVRCFLWGNEIEN